MRRGCGGWSWANGHKNNIDTWKVAGDDPGEPEPGQGRVPDVDDGSFGKIRADQSRGVS